MRSIAKSLSIFIIITPLAGCVSWLTSGKADDEEKGIRYSLPQPFLLVTPKSDGTIDVETIMLPDSSKTYTIRQPSFIASHTLNVELEHQMLKAIDLNADTGAVTGKAIEAYGDLRKASIEAEAAQAKSQSDKTAAATKRVADARLAVAKAQAVVDYLDPDKDKPAYTAEYIKAQVALQQAEAERAAAEDDARTLGIEGFNIIVKGTAPTPKAFGPVLYQIEQTINTDKTYKIRLIAASFERGEQQEFDTSKIALPPEDKPAEFKLSPAEDVSKGDNSTFETSTTVQVEVDPDPDKKNFAIRKIAANGSVLQVLPEKPDVLAYDGGRKLKISFPANLSVGDYRISMSLKVGKATHFTTHDVRILRR